MLRRIFTYRERVNEPTLMYANKDQCVGNRYLDGRAYKEKVDAQGSRHSDASGSDLAWFVANTALPSIDSDTTKSSLVS